MSSMAAGASAYSPLEESALEQTHNQDHQLPFFSCIQILYSTQTGRAKACARRTARILREQPSLFGSNGSGACAVSVPSHQSVDQYQLYQKLLQHQLKQQQQREDGSNNHQEDPKILYLFFISTTGEGEHCDSIQQTWKALLNKSLNATTTFASSIWFGLFCLGDRAYGDLFCAAGRKWAVRLLQLGATLHIPTIGYGDDGDGDAGVFSELDVWIQSVLLPQVGVVVKRQSTSTGIDNSSILKSPPVSSQFNTTRPPPSSYQLQVEQIPSSFEQDGPSRSEEWQLARFSNAYRTFFANVMCPVTAYSYVMEHDHICRCPEPSTENTNTVAASTTSTRNVDPPLIGTVLLNKRITAVEWEQQDTRHIRIRIEPSNNTHQPTESHSKFNPSGGLADFVEAPLPYRAGDIAVIIPRNSNEEVSSLLQVLPNNFQEMADAVMTISRPEPITTTQASDVSVDMAVPWPLQCTLRGWLTFCADIHSLPEREDLRALSKFCSPCHPLGREQQAKLISLSEPSESALYVDYIIREKRSWRDVLFDFDSIRYDKWHGDPEHDSKDGCRSLTLVDLLTLLPPMRPRDFSLASAPSWKYNVPSESLVSQDSVGAWDIELCVGVVQGKTRSGRRHYHGLCSTYLAGLQPSQLVQLWIRPGSFGSLPLEPKVGMPNAFDTPILCIAAGTGIAPMRSLLLEREAVRRSRTQSGDVTNPRQSDDIYDNGLIFGCRKATADFYYQEDWDKIVAGQSLRLWTAFSQEQGHKVYVQQVLRTIHEQNAFSLINHGVQRLGAIYIAGNPKMARAVKDEIKAILAKEVGEKEATRFMKKLQRLGRFCVEAWG